MTFELPFGTFSKGDKIAVTYIPGYFKLGRGIQEVATVEGTLERVRTHQGKQYLVVNLPGGKVLELRGDDLHNVVKASAPASEGR